MKTNTIRRMDYEHLNKLSGVGLKALIICMLMTLTGFVEAVTINIQPGDIEVAYRIPGTPIYNVSGPQSGDLEPGGYSFCISDTCIPFNVNANGTVSGAVNDSLEFDGDTIRFRPGVTVYVDPGDVDISYRIPSSAIYNVNGPQSDQLVPGTSMRLYIADTYIPFNINADGTVSGAVNDSLEFDGDTIRFRPGVTLFIEPGDVDIKYRIPSSAIYSVNGPQSDQFVPGTSMRLYIGDTYIPFNVNADGTVSGAVNDSLEFDGDTIRFRPGVTVYVEPGDADISYRIPSSAIYNVKGAQSDKFVPGTTMKLCVGGECGVFSIEANGAVQPGILEVAGYVFLLSSESVDSDEDGLSDEEELLIGTDPLNPDTDGDGLFDGTEVDMAEGTGCPSPLVRDSDRDSLWDGIEVEAGTNVCSVDTDGDGIPDNIDPFPTDPGGTPGFLEQELRLLCDDVAGLDLGFIAAKNNNAAKGRRNAICNKLNSAANAVAAGDYLKAIDQLTSLTAKLDDVAQPKDWMVESEEKTQLRSDIEKIQLLLEFL